MYGDEHYDDDTENSMKLQWQSTTVYKVEAWP